ncbi:ATP-binding protein [Thermoproteota archaeon]
MLKGQIISGEFGKICIRQKADARMELGELLVSEIEDSKVLLQVYDLLFGSQVSQANLELISGMQLEEKSQVEFFDHALRNYNLAVAKPLIVIGKQVNLCKQLPWFFSQVRDVTETDLKMFTKPEKPLFVGNLRSGSRVMDVPINLPGEKVIQHHILIPATTGRGKSNLVKTMLWDLMGKDYCGMLVLDPHDEYYGRNGLGLSNHPTQNKLAYYTADNPPPGALTLRIHLSVLRPAHFRGVVSFSDPQVQAMNAYYREYKERWIEAIVMEKPLKVEFQMATLAVLKRRLLSLLDLEYDGKQLYTQGIFSIQGGDTTITDIAHNLEQGKIVVVDTSSFEGAVELLVGALVTTEIFNRYKRYKFKGVLEQKPVVSIILEEAPRVLGKDVIEKGGNIFSTIAREGRKFKVGLIAITQLPSLIPREVLANLNTKIILGIEMGPERQAIIDSAAQDLSTDSRSIASLDKGEAIITSTFVKFPTPIKIPLFDDFAKENSQDKGEDSSQTSFAGIKIE